MARLGPPVDYNPFESKNKKAAESTPKVRLGPPVDFNPFEKPGTTRYAPGNLPMSKRAQAKAYKDSAPLREQEAIDRINAENPNRPQNIIPNVAANVVTGTGEAGAGIFGTLAGYLFDPPPSDEDYADAAQGYDVNLGDVRTDIINEAATAGQNVRQSVADTYPMPAGLERLKARQAGREGLDYAKQFAVEPIGTAQMAIQQLAQSAPFVATMGPVAGSGALEAALGGSSAADSFDQEWAAGVIQQSDTYQNLAKNVGEEQAREILRSKRIADTQFISGAVGAGAAKITGVLGLNPVEQALAGKAVGGSMVGKAAKELIGEPIEEMAVQIPQNFVDISTGSDKTLTEGVIEAGIAGAVVGPGTAATVSAPSTIINGAKAIRNRLSPSKEIKAPIDVTPTTVTPPSATPPIDISSSVTPVVDTNTTATSTTELPIVEIQNSRSDSRVAGTPSLQQEQQSVNSQEAPITLVDTQAVPQADGKAVPVEAPVTPQNQSVQAPATTIAAPTQEVPQTPVQSVPATYTFKTSKGSTYEVNGVSTTRTKSDHTAVGHDKSDVGKKEPSIATVYISPENSGKVSWAGLSGSSDFRVVLDEKNKRAFVLSWNEKAGKWGMTSSMREGIPYETTPAVGMHPVEVWKEDTSGAGPTSMLPEGQREGLREFKGVHEGNQIVEISSPSSAATATSAPVVEQAKAPKAEKLPSPQQGATTELQARAQTDATYRARIERNPTLFMSDVKERAAQIEAERASSQPQQVPKEVIPSTQSVPSGEAVQGREGQGREGQKVTASLSTDQFGKGIGAVRAPGNNLHGRVNKPVAKSILAGDSVGVVSALQKSKNVLTRAVASMFGHSVPKFVIDENAKELGAKRVINSDMVEFAVGILETLDKLRESPDATPPASILVPGEDGTLVQKNLYTEDTAPRTRGWYVVDVKEKHRAARRQAFLDVFSSIPGYESYLRRMAAGVREGVVVGGKYDPVTNTVAISDPKIAEREDVVVHEIVHAQAHKALNNPSARQKPYVQRLTTLLETVREAASKSKENRNADWSNSYGLTDIHEFLSEGMSNPAFQYKLSQVPVERVSAWTKFTQYIAGLVGMKADNAFTEMLEVYQGLVGEPSTPEDTQGTASLSTGQPVAATYASEQELKDDLFSGILDPEASNAQKMDNQGRLIVYNGLNDLAAKDPQAAAGLQKAAQKVSGNQQTVSARAFVWNGKVYMDTSRIEKGKAKSTFLHEGLVHIEADASPKQANRVLGLARRVRAWERLGDADAKAAMDHVKQKYAGLLEDAKKGDRQAAMTANEEILAKYVQILYDKYNSDRSMPGTVKRILADIISYFRDKISRFAKAAGLKGLKIRDKDILDAVRYRRDVEGFYDDRYTPKSRTAPAPAATSSKLASLSVADNTPTTQTQETATDTRSASLYKRVGDVGARAVFAQGTAHPETFRTMVEERSGLEREYIFKSEAAVSAMESAIDDLVKSNAVPGRTKDMYLEDALKYFRGDNNVVLPKKLKDSVDSIRGLITELQTLGIAYGVWGPRKIAQITKSMGNGGWTRRAYMAFELNPGEWKAIMMDLARKGKRDIVGEELDNIVNAMRLPSADVLEGMRKDALRTTPEKGLDEKTKDSLKADSRKKINFWADMWGVTGTYKEKVEKLKQLSTVGENVLRDKAREYGNRMLDPRGNATFSKLFGPRNALIIDDSSIDKARKAVPEWMQRLWGKYESLQAESLISINHLANIIAKYRAMTDLLATGLQNGTIISPNDVTKSRKGYKLINSDNPHDYGPLQGHWIKEEDAWLLEQSRHESALLQLLREGQLEYYAEEASGKLPSSMGYIGKAAIGASYIVGPPGRMLKTWQTTVNHTLLFINAATNLLLFSPILTSATAIKNVPAAMSIARNSSFAGIPYLQSTLTDQRLVDIRDYMMRKGILQDSPLAASDRKYQVQKIREEADDLRSGINKVFRKLSNSTGNVFDILSRFNSVADEASKIIAFHARVEWIKSAYGITDNVKAQDMAASEVKDTMPSYARTMPLAKALGNLGIIGFYVSWHTEMARTSINLIRNGGNKIAEGVKKGNAELVKYGMFDLAQVGLRTMAVTMVDALIAGPIMGIVAGMGSDDEEKKQIEKGQEIEADVKKKEALIEITPEWNKTNIHATRDLGDGRYVVATTRRWEATPVGPMLAALARGDTDLAQQIVKDTVASVYPTAIGVTGVGYGSMKLAAADSSLEKTEAWDIIDKNLGDILRSLNTGSIKVGSQLIFNDEKNDVKFTEGEHLLSQTGFTVSVLNTNTQIPNYVYLYQAGFADAQRRLSKAVFSEDGAIDLFNAASIKHELWKDTRRKVEAAKVLGRDYDWFESSLKAYPATENISEAEIRSLWEGEFRLPDYEKFLDDRMEKEIDRKPDKEAEIIKKYDGYKAQLKSDWPKIEKMLSDDDQEFYVDD